MQADHTRYHLRCFSCADKTTQSCDGCYPCSACAQHSQKCAYPPRVEPSSSWTQVDPDLIERYPETLHLSSGIEGFARLDPVRGKRRKIVHLEWQPVVEQREDLRIRQHPLYPPILLYPSSIRIDPTTHESDSGVSISDDKLLAQARESLSDTSIHPTILLNSVLHTRTGPNSSTNSTPSHAGNTLSISSTSISPQNSTTSHAVWSKGNSSGQASSIGFGEFFPPQLIEEHHGRPSRDAAQNASGLWSLPHTFHPFPLFRPRASTVTSYESPILSLQLAPIDAATSCLLAVRTCATVSILQGNLSVPSPDVPPGKTEDPVLAHFDYAGWELGRRALADVVLGGVGGGDRGSGMLADIDGGLWGWGIGLRGSGRVGDFDWTGERPEMFRLRKGRKGEGYRGRVRIGYGGARGLDAVVALDDEVLLYDLRSPTASSSLVDIDMLARGIPYGTDQSPSLVTSLAAPAPRTRLLPSFAPTSTPTSMHVVCTTRDLIWLDDRMPGRDLMRWSHGRAGRGNSGYDHSLSLMHLEGDLDSSSGDSIDRVVLHSRLHPLLSIHTYSSSAALPPRSLLDPYSLPSPTSTSPFSRTGLAIVSARSKRRKGVEEEEEEERADEDLATENGWLVMESGTDGGVWGRYATLREYEEGAAAEEGLRVMERRSWGREVRELERAGRELRSLAGEGAEETGRRKPLGRMVERIFGETDQDGPGGDDEVVEDSLEKAVKALRAAADREEEGAANDKGVLTLFDLMALPYDRIAQAETEAEEQAPDIPSLPHPTTFLRLENPSSQSKTLANYASIFKGATDDLNAPASWSAMLLPNASGNDSSLQGTLRPDVGDKWSHMKWQARLLRERYAVDSDDDEQPALAAAACDQVVLDTALASRLYSLRPALPAPPSFHVNTPHPPHLDPDPLHLSYFRPRAPDALADAEEPDDHWKRKSLDSVGVRLLLSEWTVGTNPDVYAWSNPYAGEKFKDAAEAAGGEREAALPPSARDNGQKRFREPSSSFDASGSGAFHPSAPPGGNRGLHSVREEDAPSSDPFVVAATQPVGAMGGGDFSSQTWTGAASQVLPGAFGGRVSVGDGQKKKKPGKKRVSGF